MNALTIFLTFTLCTVAIQARHYSERLETDESDAQVDPIRRAREHGANQIRHRRRSWTNNYGYDYPQPPNPYYPDQRNDYDRNQELLPQILRLLDEISAYVKRPPPPPPQPIYVPYAVPYPVPQYCSCPSRKPIARPNVTSRFPDMEDPNQNWGFAQTDEDEINDDSDGSRPISFTPIVSKNKGRRNQPKVEHGSSQAGGSLPSHPASAPSSLGSTPRLPSQCEVAALSCCNNGSPAQQQQCFDNVGCLANYDSGNACHRDRITAIIDAYARAYSPVN